jgi:hypothetical protein
MTAATSKTAMMTVECKLAAHRKVYRVSGDWPFHEQNYLKTPADATENYAELHKDMRRYGIDWFSPTTAKALSRKPLTEAHKRSITVGMLRSKLVWNRGKRTGLYHFRDKSKKPHEHEWAITTSNDFLIVTNLKDWCRTVGVSYSAIIGKIRYNSWPYVPRPNLNIQQINRYGKR